MTRADLHVHSEHSRHPSEWFLQRIGAQESYTPVETIYQLARARGNDFVTLTDHNAIGGALRLAERHPGECFVSTEITTYFPENGCKIHVLAYGITEEQFKVIQKARGDIYNLRDVLRSERIACSVAHATYSINGRLRTAEIEKLLLLFDVFEAINGARGKLYNQAWFEILRKLTPDDIDRLYRTHRIEPWSEDPWRKGFTGGSDDHAGLYVGGTHTTAPADSLPAFLDALRERRTQPGGRYGDHKSLAFALYKIAGDLAREKDGRASGLLQQLVETLFDERRPGLRKRWAVRKIRRHRQHTQRMLGDCLHDLLLSRERLQPLSLDAQVDRAYTAMAGLLDGLLDAAVTSFDEVKQTGDTWRLLQHLSSTLPVAFLAVPFFSTLRILHHDRALIDALRQRFHRQDQPRREKKLLWFSDTVTELNGVAVTMRALADCAHRQGRAFKLVACLDDDNPASWTPPSTVLRLPCLRAYTPDFYTSFTLRFPSLLKALDLIAAEQPDEIVLSTVGPLGWIGFLSARLLGIRCVAVYHTDLSSQVEQFTGDAGAAALVEAYSQWFHAHMDEVRVPTAEYIELLSRRGIPRERMKLFRRGLDAEFRRLDPLRLEQARQRWFAAAEGPTLLWAGRMGGEKGLDFLADVYEQAAGRIPGLRLLLAGDGPERERLEQRFRGRPDVLFAGRLDRDALRYLYALSDLFVFPSVTDTFGMVVLEALSLGLPALVSDVGGPQEIVRAADGGRVLPAGRHEAWVQAVVESCRLLRDDPDAGHRLRLELRDRMQDCYDWSTVLDDMAGPVTESRLPTGPASAPEFAGPFPSDPVQADAETLVLDVAGRPFS